jgi:signal transduction histidine kinase
MSKTAASRSARKNRREPETSPPESRPDSFRIVGIGASAGGFESISTLLKNLRPDTGLAFVVIQHLGPASQSALANLLVKTTEMPVLEIRDGMPVEPNHVYVLTPNYDVLLENRTLRLVRRPNSERVHMPIDHFFQSLAEQEKERAVGVVLSGTGSDGTLGLRAIKGEDGLTFAEADETETRQAQQALERSRQQLLEALKEKERAREEAVAASKAKDHFLAVLSHELRTPLTPVLLAAQLLARRDDLPADVYDSLEMIRNNVRIESQFIDDLLDMTRIAQGKVEIAREPVNVHDAIKRAVEITYSDLEAKRQRLVISLNAQRNEVTGDRTRLQQVFWNLLKNASKFTPEGGEIRIESRNENNRIAAVVSDQGIGIEPEALPLIFNSFKQASEQVTREFGGLGLGLAISKATVDAHEGTLRAASRGSNKGATFTVELPLRSDAKA